MDFSSDAAREHHYVFGHRMLPDMLEWPASLTDVVTEGDFGRVLRGIWDRFGENLSPADRLSSDGLEANIVDVGGTPGVLIVLPPAEHWNEAYAALIVPLDPIEVRRIFMLERQLADGSEDPGTMVCEWSRNNEGISHGNFGYGPPAWDHETFISRVAGLIA